MIGILISAIFIIICVLLIIVVLLQKGRGGGLGAAFGGLASSAFGTRIGDVFTWVTIVLTALFLLLAIGTTMWYRPEPSAVARPTFNPPPGEYNDAEVVTIASATPDAKIYYTLDGSVPAEKAEGSRLYENAVRIEPGRTLKARAYRAGGWTPSEVAVGYYGLAPIEQASQPAGEIEATTQPAGEASPADQPSSLPASE